MFVILQHRHSIKQEPHERPDNADYDHYHDMVDLSWFSHGGPKITGITTTPSELERNGRALDSANGSDMEVDG